MLSVYGCPMPNLGIKIEEDKNLFLDINHGDLNQIYDLDPNTTYIITTRKLDDLEEIILAGYFNILTVSAPSKITTRVIANFITTNYGDNQLKVISERMLSLYDEYGPITNQLCSALEALRDDDVATFSRIMSINLYNILASMNDINKMAAFCKSLSTAENSYSSLVAASTKAELALADAERYKKLYEEEKTRTHRLGLEVSEYKNNIVDLQGMIASDALSQPVLEHSADYVAMQTKLEALTAEKEKLALEFEEYKKSIEEQAPLVGGESDSEIIAHLREELRKAQTLAFDQIVNSRMPIFQESTALNAEHIFYFKEIRPAVYMNSFLAYAGALLKIKYKNIYKKEYLIIVLDTLCDQYAVSKYRKRGWAINSRPDPKNGILVTNCFDFSRLKSEYNVDTVDLVLVIDRTHVTTDAVQISRAHKYYFVNTINDMTDYNLEPAYCIGFLGNFQSESGVYPKYRVDPWDPMLSTTDSRKRCGKCSNDKILETILNETGVLS